MRTALIYPPALQYLFQDQTYHLVLAHLFQQKNYRDFVRQLKGHKILDNGAAESQLTKGRNLIEIGWTWEVNEIVVPDLPMDYHGTLATARQFKQHVVSDFEYIGVAQGRTISEVMACMNGLSLLSYITKLALPRSLCRDHKLNRYYLAETLHRMDLPSRFKAVHCLGSSAWPKEAVSLAEIPIIVGIDTSMPVKLGLNQLDISKVREYHQQPTKNEYFDIETVTLEQETCIVNNARTYREWAA